MNWGTMTTEVVMERLAALFMLRQESALAQLEFGQYQHLANEPIFNYIMREGSPNSQTQDLKFLNLEINKV